MSTSNSKSRRTSTEQSSPRAVSKNSKKCLFAPSSASPTSSSSQSPSPPRRRDVLKSTVINAIRKRSSTAVPQYRGVRYREELNKYVSEIRPTRCSKKIWLGTYDTAEEAARAFDIGNLCCNKDLPLNFEDSRNMLKKISSHLSPEESRSAIAKLAKEVARLYSTNPSSSGEIAKPEPVSQAAATHSEFVQFPAQPQFVHYQTQPQFVQYQTQPQFVQYQTHPQFVPYQAFQPQPAPQIQHSAATGFHSETYLEQLPENVCEAMEVATPMPVVERGNGSRSWSFDLSIGSASISEMSLPDDLSAIPILNDMPEDHMYEDHMYQYHALFGDQCSGGQVYGDVIYYS